jgi:hypothetical protein
LVIFFKVQAVAAIEDLKRKVVFWTQNGAKTAKKRAKTAFIVYRSVNR